MEESVFTEQQELNILAGLDKLINFFNKLPPLSGWFLDGPQPFFFSLCERCPLVFLVFDENHVPDSCSRHVDQTRAWKISQHTSLEEVQEIARYARIFCSNVGKVTFFGIEDEKEKLKAINVWKSLVERVKV
jgi:hypothetical protein